MASLPIDPALTPQPRPAQAETRGWRLKRPSDRRTWLYLLFGSGPCWYRLLRFGQRHRD